MTFWFFLEAVACPATNLLGVAYPCVMSTREQEQSHSRSLLQNCQHESRGCYCKEFANLTSELIEAEGTGKGR